MVAPDDGMSTTAPTSPAAWEPLTPRGVAAFARAPWRRLLLAQLVVALLAAAVTGWFLEEEWFPVVRAAIRQMPDEGEIRTQRLDWRGSATVKLAGNHFLGLGVDLDHSGQLVRESQVQLEFGRRDLQIIVAPLPGRVVVDYPAGWRIAFNRPELDSRWGAWEPELLAGVAAAMFAGLLLSWAVLATIYCVPVRLITLYENRDLNWGQSWRLSGAALMPGALFLIFGMLVYGVSSMALVQLGIVWALHLVIGWIYLFVSPFFLPRHPAAEATRGNPFSGERKKGKK
jgi:hypothetical protein